MTPETKRRRLLELAGALALAVAGFALRALAGDSVALQAVGYGLVGVAGVAAVSALFYEIGLSEDDERRSASTPPTAPDRPTADPSPPPRLRRGPPSPRRRGAR